MIVLKTPQIAGFFSEMATSAHHHRGDHQEVHPEVEQGAVWVSVLADEAVDPIHDNVGSHP